MNAARAINGLWVCMVLLLLWGVAFSVACNLTGETIQAQQGSVLAKMFGTSRAAFSEHFFEEADRYFHKGIRHYRKKAFVDRFVKLGRDITPGGHMHLHDKGVKEIMPMLYFSTKMDPQNVTAYVVTAFWLAGDIGRPDLAERVLAEAQRYNPHDYRVYLENGRLALKQGKMTDAANAFDVAIRLWPSKQDPEGVETQMDMVEILGYRGLLYEAGGNIEKALSLYKKSSNLFPSRTGLRERIKELEMFGRALSPPSNIWGFMLLKRRHVCDRQDHDHAELEHDHHGQ